jgi:hypothetical protein
MMDICILYIKILIFIFVYMIINIHRSSRSFSLDNQTTSDDGIGEREREEELSRDPVREALAIAASWLYQLPLDISVCAKAIRSAKLDVLIYPEVGIDPVTYYLSFARLAPVQVNEDKCVYVYILTKTLYVLISIYIFTYMYTCIHS